MYSKVYSGTWEGIFGTLIEVEADISSGLPVFEMVGYLSSEVKEAKERVRTALKNQGFTLPPKRITVNLSPAHIRKSGSSFDLAVAISVLLAGEYLVMLPKPVLFLGEVGLDGSLKPVQGVLPVILCAREERIGVCIVPKENEKEGRIAKDISVIGLSSLKEVVTFLEGLANADDTEKYLKKFMNQEFKKIPSSSPDSSEKQYDFADIKGQQTAKRAIEIAVSGHHNLLMSGNPGSGKSALAKRIPSIMPSMSYEEQLELTKIYSIHGMLMESGNMISKRPYRAPHHSITTAAMAGGGVNAGPGELSLAHKGVLFLDEFPEFSRQTLEMMRQPLEEGEIIISRNKRTCTYPADFMLVAAMNPCPCGFYPDRSRCFCSERQVKNYQNRISGPLLDRIDLMVQIQPVPFERMRSEKKEESSDVIRKRVERTRQIQRERYKTETYSVNAQLNEQGIQTYCKMEPSCENRLGELIKRYNLSYRSYVRILKIARTIADMEGKQHILEEHLAEAIMFRMGWQHGE